jgi:hypothetical protein
MRPRARQRPPGVELRLAPSVRSTALAVASRTVLGALAIAGAAVAVLPLLAVGGELAPEGSSRAAAAATVPSEPNDGRLTMAGLLAAVDRELRGVRATIVELEVVPTAGDRAEVRLRIDTPGGDASSVARVVAALDRARLAGPRVRSVTPVPDGARIEVAAEVVRATARLEPTAARIAQEQADAEDGRDLSVALTALVQRSGAELRRLEVRGGSRSGEERTVRVAAQAGIDPLVALLDALERAHTAPVRISTLRIEAAGEDRFDLTTVFAPRDTMSVATPSVVP